MISLPDKYLDSIKDIFKDQYDDYLGSFSEKIVHSLRVNTSKISVKDFLGIMPFKLEPVPWTDDGFYYDENDTLSKHPYYHAGLYYIQEASAMLPAEVLPIEENDYVLDCCAAPGGKSLKLANKLNDTGLLISNDISASRAQVLLKTLETGGIKNAYVMAEDLLSLNGFDEKFDKILLDAPCSGEGMFRKEPELIRSWLDKGNDYYSTIQKQLIEKAITLLKPGGMMVYSTCTFSINENEEVIEYGLKCDERMKVLPIKEYKGFEKGLTDKTKNCVRLYPHRVRGEGHFVALLQKNGNNKSNIQSDKLSSIDLDILKDIRKSFFKGNIVIRNNRYYLEPEHDLALDGLRIMRSGLYLGEMKHYKYETSQALAMALKADQYSKVLNLDIDDPRVLKYLKCETLDVKDISDDGYYLVCVNNYPLGFGMIKKGILKNKYPANYRYK